MPIELVGDDGVPVHAHGIRCRPRLQVRPSHVARENLEKRRVGHIGVREAEVARHAATVAHHERPAQGRRVHRDIVPRLDGARRPVRVVRGGVRVHTELQAKGVVQAIQQWRRGGGRMAWQGRYARDEVAVEVEDTPAGSWQTWQSQHIPGRFSPVTNQLNA